MMNELISLEVFCGTKSFTKAVFRGKYQKSVNRGSAAIKGTFTRALFSALDRYPEAYRRAYQRDH